MDDLGMVAALQACSLFELLILLQPILAREGYGDVEVLDRLLTTQKTRHGGFEMVSRIGAGILPLTCVIKVINDDIRVRMLSELVGTVDRINADVGLVITPKKLCKSAEKELPKYTTTKLQILDGEALAGLMRKHKIGVRPGGGVDYAFFGGLEDFANWSEPLITDMKRWI